MANMFASSLLCLFLALFLFKRLLRYLGFYQEEEYQSLRFCRWLFKSLAFDTSGSLLLLACAILQYVFGLSALWEILGASFLCVKALTEEDPRYQGKVRLKMTERAKSIFYSAAGLATLMGISLLASTVSIWLTALLLIQCTPFFLVLANCLLMPYERRKQERFLQEAKEIIKTVHPFVIGITGSYGKTSTKDALSKILQTTLGPTFWPPKSFNTPMGITREIRERLVKGYEYAVVEMGAYQIGSIERLCRLTPPNAAIITAVGSCHLDRFKSAANIYRAKSELAQAVPETGILVCNGDNEGARQMASMYPKAKTYLYGFDATFGKLDAHVSTWSVSEKGTVFTLNWQGRTYQSQTPLVGRSSLSNALAAFTMACALGADPEFVLAVIATLEPVDNRLQVKKSDKLLYVHDAYNSNPAGFAAALEVLQALEAKRKIVMTPGMIELGPIQSQENFQAAKHAGAFCDLAVVVGNTNRESLIRGFKEGGMKASHIYQCDSRQKAFEMLDTLRQDGDAILIENDLTDIYEAKVKF